VICDDLEPSHVDSRDIYNAHAGVCEDRDGAVPRSDEIRIRRRGEEIQSKSSDIVGLVDGQMDC
jgi:hypothetical protein